MIFIQFLRLLFHLESKDLYESPQILEHKVWNNLQNFFHNFDQLIRVKLWDALNIRALGLEHSQHRSVKDRWQLQEGIFQQ